VVTSNQSENLKIGFKGIVSGQEQNPIQMQFSLEEDSGLALIDEEENEVNTISWEENFSTMEEEYEHDLMIRVLNPRGTTTAVHVELIALSAQGRRSTCDSSIFFE
jgi:hypothetical protein